MKIVAERGAVQVVASAEWVELSAIECEDASRKGRARRVFLRFTADDARWLQAVALPAGIVEHLVEHASCTRNDHAEVPSDAPAIVYGELDERGQIPGQLAIE